MVTGLVDFQFPLLAVTFWTMMALELFLAVNEQMAREIVLPWKWFVTYLATVHPCCRLDRCFLELLHLKTGIGSFAGLIYIARDESISWWGCQVGGGVHYKQVSFCFRFCKFWMCILNFTRTWSNYHVSPWVTAPLLISEESHKCCDKSVIL